MSSCHSGVIETNIGLKSGHLPTVKQNNLHTGSVFFRIYKCGDVLNELSGILGKSLSSKSLLERSILLSRLYGYTCRSKHDMALKMSFKKFNTAAVLGKCTP